MADDDDDDNDETIEEEIKRLQELYRETESEESRDYYARRLRSLGINPEEPPK